MALPLSRAARLKPEIRLAQALSEYEAVLADDQKAKLRGYRAQCPPSATDVMRLTAEIDQDAVRNRKSRRCVGPRLSNVLQAVQQFASVVDIAVGGSQCPIASGVWGVLKLSLQVASSFSSYFDQLSMLLMNIGRSCPRNQEYMSLYPLSPRLQGALCEYFIVIVKLCKQSVLFLDKSFLSQLSVSVRKPFQSEFGNFQQDLDRLAGTIREEASLASSHAQQQEIKENSNHRALVARSSDQHAEWRRQQRVLEYLNACSTYDHRTAWKQARKRGTVGWLYQEEVYQKWKEESIASILHCYGKLGSGKSVLAANIVDDVFLNLPDALVAYFFCRYNDAASLTARSIIGSVTRQILEGLKQTMMDMILPTNTNGLDTDEIMDTLLAALQRQSQQGLRTCILVLDGLDECEESEITALLGSVRRLTQSGCVFKVFITTRPDVSPWVFEILEPQWTLSMSRSNSSNEMVQYVESTLAERLEGGSLCLGDPEIIIQIRHALVSSAHGMYLWVAFQIDSICAQQTDADILSALEDLPRDLPETFNRILRKLQHSKGLGLNSNMHTKVFNIVAAAQRPLTLAELREAISVEPGETPWDSTKAANDMFKLIQCCGSLLVVDEEDLTAHFAHYSVLQYLCSENVDRTLNAYHIHPVGASSLLGEICVTYLNYEHLDTQLVKASENPRPQLITPSIVLRESLALKNIVIKLAVKYLTSRRNVGHDISPLLEKAVAVNPELEKKTAQEHLFLYYAREFWLFHIKSCSSLNGGKVKPLWRRLIAGKLRTVQLPWAPENFSDFSPEFMEWVIEHQYWALLSEAIEQTGQTSDIFEQRVLRRLSPKELETDTVQVLPKEVLIATLNRYGLMAVGQICLMNKTYAEVLGGIELQQASTRGELATIRLLIERGADVNTKDSKNGFSQLHLAFTQGKPAVVKLLLENGADIHAECGTFGSALQAASIQGHEEIVMLLVGKGADVNAKGGTYGNALQGACCGTGDEEIVKLLLKGGADVNAIGGLYGTALHAVSHHHVEDEGIMELLLENGADVNAQAGSWGTALHVLASLYDRESMVRRLLHYGADVNINCGRYGTALQAASFNGHQATVKILLEKGADVNAEGGRTGSALQAARVYEHKAIEKLLLEHGTIDPDKPNMKMMKYLQRQSTRGLGSGAASVDMEGAKFNAEDGPSSQNSWP